MSTRKTPTAEPPQRMLTDAEQHAAQQAEARSQWEAHRDRVRAIRAGTLEADSPQELEEFSRLNSAVFGPWLRDTCTPANKRSTNGILL